MSEIREYRGKRLDNGEWVYGLLACSLGEYIIQIYHFEDYNGKKIIVRDGSYSIDTETVGQYTGLKDKNGTKVFEGDIINGENYIFPVYDSRPMSISWSSESCGFEMNRFNLDDCEVIGNIHDNPELLEVDA